MKKTLYSILLLFLFSSVCSFSYAQTPEVDSLQKLLADHPEKDTSRIHILNDLAFAYFYVDRDKTLLYAQEADSLSELIEYTKGKALSLKNIGLCYYARSEFDTALVCYEQSLELFSEIGDAGGKAKIYNNIGIIYELTGDYRKASDYYMKSLKLKKELGDSLGMASCYNNIGIVNHNMGDYPKALEYYQKCLHIETALADSSGMAGSFNNIGAIYFELDEYEKALDYHKRSLNMKTALLDSTGIASAFNNIGVIYNEQEKYKEALENYKKAVFFADAIESVQKSALYYSNIGMIHMKLKEYDEAVGYNEKALLLAEEISALGTISRIYNSLARIYLETKQFSTALDYGKKAYQTAHEINHKVMVKDACEILSMVYSATGNYEQAYAYLSEFKERSDSLINEGNIKKIAALEYEFKYKQEQELARAEQERIDLLNEQELIRQKTIRNSFMIGFGLTFLLAIVIFRSFIQKRRANTILQEQKEIIEDTNDELSAALKLVNEQKDQISEKNDLLQNQNEHITDSINYASRIQSAVLPKAEFLQSFLPEHFIFYKPRDIVSGDFYWAEKMNGHIIVAAADCTGHGVPGAFMSMLGISILNELVRKKGINRSNELLEELRKRVKETLWQTGDIQEQKDGIDMALYIIDTETNMLDFSGANNPLYLIREAELTVYEPNHQPIGIYPAEKPFTSTSFELKKGDCLYTFSDGYSDQLGGAKNQKFLVKRFRELLIEIHTLPAEIQKLILEEKLSEWQGKVPQMDDILVMGVKF